MRLPSRNDRRGRLMLAAALAAAALVAFAGCDLQEDSDTDRGEQLFVERCGSCHALTAAGTNAEVGPDLDAAFADSRLSGMDQDTIEGVVEYQIQNPRPASPEDTAVYMPANLVEGDELADVAAYVASVAGDPDVEPPEFIAPEFFVTNCGSCHTLGAAGTTGTVGPDLDEVLQGKNPMEVSQQITEPDSEITPGFNPGVMPPNFDQTLTAQQLRQLVDYLLQSVGGG